MKITLTISLIFMTSLAQAQQPDFFKTIPEYPDTYSANHTIVRMIDGLGFRYYWASYDLTEDNLSYKVSDDSRTLLETMEHIYGLSIMIENASKNEKVNRNTKATEKSLEELRLSTLQSLQRSREILLRQPDLDTLQLTFNENYQYPYWNVINGPISDALWHCGQIVMMRRAAGNPFPEGVNVLSGKRREN